MNTTSTIDENDYDSLMRWVFAHSGGSTLSWSYFVGQFWLMGGESIGAGHTQHEAALSWKKRKEAQNG